MSCRHQHSSSPRPFLCSHYLHMYLSTLPLSCREQELSNLLDQGRRSDAVGLAIALDHPKRVLTILNSLLEEEEEEEGFRDTVAALREDQISKWTRCTLSATYFSPLPIAHQRVYVPLFPPPPPLPSPSPPSCPAAVHQEVEHQRQVQPCGPVGACSALQDPLTHGAHTAGRHEAGCGGTHSLHR